MSSPEFTKVLKCSYVLSCSPACQLLISRCTYVLCWPFVSCILPSVRRETLRRKISRVFPMFPYLFKTMPKICRWIFFKLRFKLFSIFLETICIDISNSIYYYFFFFLTDSKIFYKKNVFIWTRNVLILNLPLEEKLYDLANINSAAIDRIR